jgi:hypothetical protein
MIPVFLIFGFLPALRWEAKLRKKKKDKQLKQEAISNPLVADAIEIFDGKLVDIKVL